MNEDVIKELLAEIRLLREAAESIAASLNGTHDAIGPLDRIADNLMSDDVEAKTIGDSLRDIADRG
jgi:hypothetical protein